jgi:hypothetical protein
LLGSLQRRLRSCIRAQTYEYDAPKLVELELYLMSRARGMPLETAGGAAVSLPRHGQRRQLGGRL